MPKIFISYRRADSISATGRLHEHLIQAFGTENVFKDVEDIPPGVDFRDFLREAVTACDVVLVVIGQQWASITGADGQPRLHDPNDFVRAEVASALANPSTLTIPVLVEGATPPDADALPEEIKAIAFRNAFSLRNDPDFIPDTHKLIASLDPDYQKRQQQTQGTTLRKGISPAVIIAVVALVLVVAVGLIVLSNANQNGSLTDTGSGIDNLLNQYGADDYISYGNSIPYEIDNAQEADFIFEGSSGDQVEISASSSDFDPVLEIYDDQDNLLASDDNQDNSTTDALVDLTLEYDGVYVIVISDSAGDTFSGSVTVALDQTN